MMSTKKDPEALVATITAVDDVDDAFEKLEIGAQDQANSTITDEETPNEDVVFAQISVDKASVEEGGELTYTVNLIDKNGDPVIDASRVIPSLWLLTGQALRRIPWMPLYYRHQ